MPPASPAAIAAATGANLGAVRRGVGAASSAPNAPRRGDCAMLATRIAKALMVASLAAFAGIVTFDNIVDYDSNFEFVRHVLSMDTTFPDNALRGRALTAPPLWHLAYALIIAVEGLTALAFAAGAAALLGGLSGGAAALARGRRFVAIGATLAFLLWFTGFMLIGGEWFAMWQSRDWNGQQAAFRFYITVLLVLLFVNQPESEPRG
jgi:predicted small integral membrane protein